jgi:hypothetical protein
MKKVTTKYHDHGVFMFFFIFVERVILSGYDARLVKESAGFFPCKCPRLWLSLGTSAPLKLGIKLFPQ